MKELIKQFINTKQFHISVIVLIIFIILLTVGMISLKYSIEGESNIPFEISQISVISNIEGTDVQDNINKWNLSVNQNNDIYLYIKRNENFKNTETIKKIVVDNIVIEKSPNIGNLKIYKPDKNLETVIFKNSEANEVNAIEYTGAIDSSIKEMQISNQGGLVIFRYAITDLGNYTSNEDVEINHSQLLKKLNINNEDLKFSLTFDISIVLDSGKTYKTNTKLDLPLGDIVNDGIQSQEYKDNEFVFKR